MPTLRNLRKEVFVRREVLKAAVVLARRIARRLVAPDTRALNKAVLKYAAARKTAGRKLHPRDLRQFGYRRA